jgi:hypothetical protein
LKNPPYCKTGLPGHQHPEWQLHSPEAVPITTQQKELKVDKAGNISTSVQQET